VLIALKVSIPLDTEAELSGKIMRRRPKKGVQTLPSSLAVLGIFHHAYIQNVDVHAAWYLHKSRRLREEVLL
jgi:hypothetical protein